MDIRALLAQLMGGAPPAQASDEDTILLDQERRLAQLQEMIRDPRTGAQGSPSPIPGRAPANNPTFRPEAGTRQDGPDGQFQSPSGEMAALMYGLQPWQQAMADRAALAGSVPDTTYTSPEMQRDYDMAAYTSQPLYDPMPQVTGRPPLATVMPGTAEPPGMPMPTNVQPSPAGIDPSAPFYIPRGPNATGGSAPMPMPSPVPAPQPMPAPILQTPPTIRMPPPPAPPPTMMAQNSAPAQAPAASAPRPAPAPRGPANAGADRRQGNTPQRTAQNSGRGRTAITGNGSPPTISMPQLNPDINNALMRLIFGNASPQGPNIPMPAPQASGALPPAGNPNVIGVGNNWPRTQTPIPAIEGNPEVNSNGSSGPFGQGSGGPIQSDEPAPAQRGMRRPPRPQGPSQATMLNQKELARFLASGGPAAEAPPASTPKVPELRGAPPAPPPPQGMPPSAQQQVPPPAPDLSKRMPEHLKEQLLAEAFRLTQERRTGKAA